MLHNFGGTLGLYGAIGNINTVGVNISETNIGDQIMVFYLMIPSGPVNLLHT
jgi:hypothetical protein